MANKRGRRRFGSVRQRASGRWQVRYLGPDGRMRPAPRTFEKKKDAEKYLSILEARLAVGEWVDPARSKIRLADYARLWIDQRAGLRPRTIELYRSLLENHVIPHVGGIELGKLDTPMIRQWRADLLERGVSTTMAAKAYRFLRAVLMTAVKSDQILTRNPCQIKGADQEQAPERPVLSIAQVFQLASCVPTRFKAMILLTTFCSLRFGEVTALERRDLDLKAGSVEVRQAYNELKGQGLVLGPPKSKAGRRKIAVPQAILPILRDHLDEFVPDAPESLAFTGPKGAAIRRGNFNKLVRWRENVKAIGVPSLHFHDLRHTGNTLAAPGSSTRDLMARMGHDSMRAALIYQHVTSEADRAIADKLNERAVEYLDDSTTADGEGSDEAA